MARYKLTTTGVYDRTTTAFIPEQAMNRHWNEYLNWVAEGNVPDPVYTADEQKANKKREINEARSNELETGTIVYDGNTYSTNNETRQNLSGIVAFVGSGGSVAGSPQFTWRTVSNQDIPMDDNDVLAFGAAMVSYVDTQYKKSWDLKAQVDALDEDAPDFEDQLDAIGW